MRPPEPLESVEDIRIPEGCTGAPAVAPVFAGAISLGAECLREASLVGERFPSASFSLAAPSSDGTGFAGGVALLPPNPSRA
eukprot:scaffold1272_cov250-Pinguiococcus_pyrenoidosus.AAC.53